MSIPSFIQKKLVPEVYTIEAEYLTVKGSVIMYSDGEEVPAYHNTKAKVFKSPFDITRHLASVKKSILKDYLRDYYPCVYKYSVVGTGDSYSVVRTLVGQLIEFVEAGVVVD